MHCMEHAAPVPRGTWAACRASAGHPAQAHHVAAGALCPVARKYSCTHNERHRLASARRFGRHSASHRLVEERTRAWAQPAARQHRVIPPVLQRVKTRSARKNDVSSRHSARKLLGPKNGRPVLPTPAVSRLRFKANDRMNRPMVTVFLSYNNRFANHESKHPKK